MSAYLRYVYSMVLLATVTPCSAMDVEPKQPQEAYLPSLPMPSGKDYLSQMPPEVLEHILTFVVENDPDAIGNLARIQEVCKGLEGFLSPNEMQWILGLTETGIHSYLVDALNKLDVKEVQLLVKFGLPKDFTDNAILYAVSAASDLSNQKGYYQRLLKIIALLETSGATWKGNVYNKPSSTLEHLVVKENLSLIRLLLDHGITPTQRSLYYAVTLIHDPEITALLLKHGAIPTGELVKSVIITGLDPQLLKILVAYGAPVNEQNDPGFTPPLNYVASADKLMETPFKNSATLAKILLDAGAIISTDAVNNAILSDNVELVALFIAHGADVNAIEGRLFTQPSLYYASSAAMAKVLLQAGAALHIECGNGMTPFTALVQTAIQTLNPMILVEVLKQRYSYQTALAIATAIMAGAPYLKTMCTIM